MTTVDLGTTPYRDAWAAQERAHTEVLAGGEEQILLVEHPPVITMGRRGETQGVKHLIASQDQLRAAGVEFVQTDRGGDITFHGPGQIVAYPIVRLNDHKLSVGGYVRGLQEAVVATLASFGVGSRPDREAIGVWVNDAKICAFGVRVKRGVTLHGLALNVSTDLCYFDLIVPCGLTGKSVTSMKKILGHACPPIEVVKQRLAEQLIDRLTRVSQP
ncbi:MAG: lipoyl(octanoyl) transferase LipB [Tepidisphaeraceae bacterium]